MGGLGQRITDALHCQSTEFAADQPAPSGFGPRFGSKSTHDQRIASSLIPLRPARPARLNPTMIVMAYVTVIDTKAITIMKSAGGPVIFLIVSGFGT